MKIEFSSASTKSEAVCIFFPEISEGKKKNTEIATYKKWAKAMLSEAFAKKIETRMQSGDFSGKAKEVVQIFSDKNPEKKFFLIGTGSGKEALDIRKSAALAIKAVKKAKAQTAECILPKEMDFREIILGLGLGNYEFKVGKKEEGAVEVKKVTIVSNKKIAKGQYASEISLVESICLTRDMVNLPTNLMTPEILAERAKEIGKGLRNPVKVTVLDEKKIEKLNMGGLLNVARGAANRPKVVVFEYYGDKKSQEKLCLAGKGVCFDSGGYNLKPTSGILTMKMDMAGAATVCGIFDWIAKNKPKKNIIGIIGAVENMINGEAYRPGDIITMMNGQTCKITNTDAEGRLVLADCLHYMTTTHKPTRVMDFATLTGACIVALGNTITGLVTNDDAFVNDIQKSAKSVNEDVWQLPLNDFLRSKIKETECDIQNWTAGVSAGASMAGAFLENFVNDTPWVHADIAGTAYHDAGNELHPKGATGAMVETLVKYIEG